MVKYMLQNFDYWPEGYILLFFTGGFILLFGALVKANGKISIPKYDWIPIIMLPIISCVFLYQIVINDTVTENEKFFSIICFVFQSGAFLFLYGEITRLMEESRRQQEEIEQNHFYEYQVEMMQKSLAEIKEVRHDMKNKLLAFSKNAAAGKNDNAVNLISDMIEECSNHTVYAKSGNMVIDSIIEYKLRQAKDLKIRFQADMMVPEELECMVSDLGVVIGNLLDNAIEAVAQTNDRWIHLKMEYTKGRLLIKMSNSYSGKINSAGNKIVTSKKDASNHGMGIKSVERVVKKFDGEMELSHNDKAFEVMLLMYLTSQEKEKKRPEEKKMSETVFITEFNGLPQPLCDWGKTAIEQIDSPEKRHEAAKEVRQRIDELWDKSFIEDINAEKKVAFVLSKLGDADLEAKRLAEKYKIKENPVKDRIIGVILLAISGLLSVHAYSIINRGMDVKGGRGPAGYHFGALLSGRAAGAEFFIIIIFTFIGLWLIFHSGKKED